MKSNFVTSPNPSEGGESDVFSDKSGGLVKNNLGEKVLPPSFGGAGGGQNVEKLSEVLGSSECGNASKCTKAKKNVMNTEVHHVFFY